MTTYPVALIQYMIGVALTISLSPIKVLLLGVLYDKLLKPTGYDARSIGDLMHALTGMLRSGACRASRLAFNWQATGYVACQGPGVQPTTTRINYTDSLINGMMVWHIMTNRRQTRFRDWLVYFRAHCWYFRCTDERTSSAISTHEKMRLATCSRKHAWLL